MEYSGELPSCIYIALVVSRDNWIQSSHIITPILSTVTGALSSSDDPLRVAGALSSSSDGPLHPLRLSFPTA